MRSLFFIFILFCIINNAFAQNTANDIINDIRVKYKTINDVEETYDYVKKSIQNTGSEPDIVKIWSNEGHIRKLVYEQYGEAGKLIEEYYFWNDTLFFSFTVKSTYNVPYYVTAEMAKDSNSEAYDPEKTKTEENRYYFNNEKLIRWLDSQKKEVTNKESILSAESGVQTRCNEIISALND